MDFFRHPAAKPLAVVALGLAVLILWGSQVVRSGWCNDEAAHIPAGLYHLETGRMDAYRVNPPLPRMIAAIPLLLDRPDVDWHYSESRYVRNEYQFAHQWVRDNHEHLRRYLLWTRGTMAGFFLLGLWVVSKWASQLYGGRAGWVAAVLWIFNPDIIANSAVVAPDLPATASGLLAGYVFWSWLIQRQRPFPWAVAAAVAFAVLCKFSWLFLLVGLPLVTLVHDAFLKRESAGERLRWLGGASIARRVGVAAFDSVRLVLSFSLTVLLINWCYGFDGSGTRLGHFEFISESLSGRDIVSGQTANRFAGGWFAWVPVPLPAEMVYGLDYLKWEFEQGMPCYLRGKWQHGGWWYFHLYAMAVKMPLGYWLLIAAGLASLILDRLRGVNRFPLEWLPVLFAIVFIALVSSQTGFTHHVRYVLPVYGFLFIVASRVAVILSGRFAIGLAAVCLSGTLWFHATHLGLAHTFFNPLADGPNNGWRHLSHSNVDWGQSTYRMVDWVKNHPEQRPMTVLFRSSLGNPEGLLADEADVFSKTDWIYDSDQAATAPARSGWYLVSSYKITLQANGYFSGKTSIEQPEPDIVLFYVGSTSGSD